MGLTHSTLPVNVDTDMNTYEIHRFFCLTAAFICNVTAEFICVSYTYEYQKKIRGLDTQRLCNQRMVMNSALIFFYFMYGEDSSRYGVRCSPWYQGSICNAQCAAICSCCFCSY